MTVYVLMDIDFIVDIYDTKEKAENARKDYVKQSNIPFDFEYQIAVLVYEVK